MQGIRLFGTMVEPNVQHVSVPPADLAQPPTPQPVHPQIIKFWGKEWDKVVRPITPIMIQSEPKSNRVEPGAQSTLIEEAAAAATRKMNEKPKVHIGGRNGQSASTSQAGAARSAFSPFKSKAVRKNRIPGTVEPLVLIRPGESSEASTLTTTAIPEDMTSQGKDKQVAIDTPSINLPPRPQKGIQDKGKRPVIDLTPSSHHHVTASTINSLSAVRNIMPTEVLPHQVSPSDSDPHRNFQGRSHRVSPSIQLPPIIIETPLSKYDFRVLDAKTGEEEEYNEAKHGKYQHYAHPDNLQRYIDHAEASVEDGTFTTKQRDFGLHNVYKSIHAFKSMAKNKGAIYHENRDKVFLHRQGDPKQALQDLRAGRLPKIRVNKDGSISFKKSNQEKRKHRLVSKSLLDSLRAVDAKQAMEAEEHNSFLVRQNGQTKTMSDTSSSEEIEA